MMGGTSFPRIVVPTDGSPFSVSAAHAAAELAQRAGVAVTLFGATESEDDRDAVTNALDELITTLRRDLVVDVIVDVFGPGTRGTDVVTAIFDEADVDGALVCIASHGRSGLGTALLGSTTEALLRKSPRPVLVVGPGFEIQPWRADGMVVACLDGSPYSEQAIPAAIEWSASFGLPLWFVQVVDPKDVAITDELKTGDVTESGYLQLLAERADDANFEVLHSDDPGHELADLADRWPVNVMVMATHGRSGWSRVTLGSVAMSVVRRATCPVLLVRPEPADAESTTGRADHTR